MADFLLITIGSHGDVHPFVGIGRALRDRGHRVRIAVNPAFESLIQNAGLEHLPIGVAKDFTDIQANPDLWHATRGPVVIMNEIARSFPVLYDLVEKEALAGTTIVGSTLCIGARIASEKLGLPMATVHLAPICIRSSERMPVLPGGFDSNIVPRFLRPHFWAGADRFYIDRIIAPPLNAFRAEKGLPPVTRVQDGWWHSPHRTIGLWPEWFFPRQSDYPEQVRLAGFPLYDESDHSTLDAELADWIAAGTGEQNRPIAFTPGSAMLFGGPFFEAAVDACVRLGRRGLLMTRHTEHLPKNLPISVRHVPFAPFGNLLPLCSAIVHHGGIGTTAQALRAGIPQVVMPMSHDQFDNAAICRKLGVAQAVGQKKFTGRRVAKTLDGLLKSNAVRHACTRVAFEMGRDRPLDRVCELLEATGSSVADR